MPPLTAPSQETPKDHVRGVSDEGNEPAQVSEDTSIGQAPPPLTEAEPVDQPEEQTPTEEATPATAEAQPEQAPEDEAAPAVTEAQPGQAPEDEATPATAEAQPEQAPEDEATPAIAEAQPEQAPEDEATPAIAEAQPKQAPEDEATPAIAEAQPEQAPAERTSTPSAEPSLPDQQAEEERIFTRPRNIKDLKPGMVLEGKVTSVAIYGAFVDIGVGREGLVHLSQLSDQPVSSTTDVVQIGDMVTVRVLDVDLGARRISLTMREQAGPEADLEKIRALTPGTILEGTVTSRTRFGLFVDVGVGKDGLVPQSHVVQEADSAPQVGEQVQVRVLEVDKKAVRIRLSMRDIHDPAQFAALRPGMVLNGRVASLAPFGAFVDVGVGKDGLVHISEMGDGSIRHPQEMLQVGQELEVRVVDVDPDTQRISLSLQLEGEEEGWVPDWQEEEEEDLPEGDATLQDLVARFGAMRATGPAEDTRTTSHAEKKKRAVREAIQRTLEQMRQQEE